jgi:hypothetical protein
VRLGLLDAPGAGDVATRVELELRLERLDLERGHRAAPGERGGGTAGEIERRRDGGGRLGPSGEDLVELVVVEAGVGADAAAVEGGRARLAPPAQVDLGRDRQPLDARSEAAHLVAEQRRQHRLDRAGDVGGGAPGERLGVERGAGADVGRDVGDVDPEADAIVLGGSRDGVVEVPRRRGVNGEGRHRGQVAPGDPLLVSRQPHGALGLLGDAAAKAPIAQLPQERGAHVAGAPRGAELGVDAGAGTALCGEHHGARAGRPASGLRDGNARAAAQERLDDREAPPALDHPDEALAGPLAAHRWRATSFASSRTAASAASSGWVRGSSAAWICGSIPTPARFSPFGVKYSPTVRSRAPPESRWITS